ncbi:hypothetical protein NAG17_21660, partial [Pseudomonas aeruginosa]|nr:hypothetical protein [Pseudomonas aeruginosa]
GSALKYFRAEFEAGISRQPSAAPRPATVGA